MMEEYLLGLLEAAQIYFDEEIEIKKQLETDKGLEFKLTFEDKIHNKRDYHTSKILSLGIAKRAA